MCVLLSVLISDVCPCYVCLYLLVLCVVDFNICADICYWAGLSVSGGVICGAILSEVCCGVSYHLCVDLFWTLAVVLCGMYCVG